MAYSDNLRQTSGVDFEDVADLIDGVYPTWTSWTPTLSAAGSMTYTSTSITFAKYIQINKLVQYKLSITGTVGGTPNTYLIFTLPVTAVSQNVAAGVVITDNSLSPVVGAITFNATTSFAVYRYDRANYTAGTVAYTVYGHYEAA